MNPRQYLLPPKGEGMTQKFIMIASSKGGVGKSTAALGISHALSSMGHSVLLCDLDFGNACLDMLLGVQDSVVYTIQDVSAGKITAGDALVKIEKEAPKKKKILKSAKKPEGELWLLPSCAGGAGCIPSFGGEATGEREELIAGAVKAAAQEISADFVIIDTGAGLNRAVNIGADLSDIALVVTGQMPVALRSAEATVARLYEMGVGDIRLIINSFDARGVIDESRKGLFGVIDESRAPLLGVIPYDYNLMLTHERLLPRGNDAECAFSNIARRLCGENVPIFSGMKRMRKLKNKICL